MKMKKEIIISDKSNEIRKPAVASPPLCCALMEATLSSGVEFPVQQGFAGAHRALGRL